MTLEDLVGLTTYQLNHERAQNCKVLKIRPRKNFQRFSFVIRGFESWSKPKGHVVTVLYPELKKKDLKSGSGVTPMNTDVLVHCSCEAWQYWGSAYWSTQDDYNIKVYKENRPPYIRDPNKLRYACKHIIRASRYMRKKGFSYLHKRFQRASNLDSPTKDDIINIISEYMRRKHNASTEDIIDILSTLNEDNIEDKLEECGIIISDTVENKKDYISSMIEGDIF